MIEFLYQMVNNWFLLCEIKYILLIYVRLLSLFLVVLCKLCLVVVFLWLSIFLDLLEMEFLLTITFLGDFCKTRHRHACGS